MATVQGVLQDMTAKTQAAIDDPDATAFDRYLAAAREEGAYMRVEPGPCDRQVMTPAAECSIDYSAEIQAEAADGPEADIEAAL